jgi:hypothetical protein
MMSSFLAQGGICSTAVVPFFMLRCYCWWIIVGLFDIINVVAWEMNGR